VNQKLFLIIIFIFLFSTVLFAQGIQIRTVPIVANSQAEFFLSLARGMGNLSIAFDDPLGDPFINPAKASRIRGATIFTSPTRNSWSNVNGRPVFTSSGSSKYLGTSMSSIPFGGFFQMGNTYAGGFVSYQGYSSERTTLFPEWGFSSRAIRKDIGSNTHVFGLFGVRFPESNFSIAGSISWSDYEAFDGVNLLYPGSYNIKQSGWSRGYKLGILAELTDVDQLEFVAARSILKASHKVTYPALFGGYMPFAQTRSELNRDESSGWILHGAYKRRIDDRWKIGAIVTVNWKEHPKIPNYELAGIPRDPGTSIAYNIGIGAAAYGQRSTLGFEYIYEPITSYTWAEAGEGSSFPDSTPLAPDFKTVENFFDFSNHILRIGLQSKTKYEWLENRFGVQLHFYKYNLNQHDNIWRTSRLFKYDWLEATLSGGLNVKFSNIELMYTLQVILGNGMVGTSLRWGAESNAASPLSASVNDFIIAPSGALAVDKIPLFTHQIGFVYRFK
jgi:hypothetical protein